MLYPMLGMQVSGVLQCNTREYVIDFMRIVRHDSIMGWLRLVGSIKLQVSFAEYCLFYRAFLQKRPII